VRKVVPLLNVANLKTHFFTARGVARAVDGISFRVDEGDFLGLVGESGSGKSVTALSIMRLVPHPGRIVDGSIDFAGRNLLDLSMSQMQTIRGGKIAMAFQDPMTYLNPVHRVGDQIAEAILLHEDMSRSEAVEKAITTMEKMRINDAQTRVKDYPHQMSGGMRQRCLLAIALSCNPELLIADEPTTSVDVITQDAILKLLKDVKSDFKLSCILITHNLGVVAGFANRIGIMYAGDIVEIGDVKSVFSRPGHPYTRGLLGSVPRLDKASETLVPIRGVICDNINPPQGCKFHPRCDSARESCKGEKPQAVEIEPGHFVACHHV
jgi:oligopeptide/dipeptide ABC transporter ATP-binding protein